MGNWMYWLYCLIRELSLLAMAMSMASSFRCSVTRVPRPRSASVSCVICTAVSAGEWQRQGLEASLIMRWARRQQQRQHIVTLCCRMLWLPRGTSGSKKQSPLGGLHQRGLYLEGAAAKRALKVPLSVIIIALGLDLHPVSHQEAGVEAHTELADQRRVALSLLHGLQGIQLLSMTGVQVQREVLPHARSQLSKGGSKWRTAAKRAVPERAMVPRLSSISCLVMPMPVSLHSSRASALCVPQPCEQGTTRCLQHTAELGRTQ